MSDIIETLGCKDSYDIRDYKLVGSAKDELPVSFSLNMPRVKNQGSVSSCVAHALSTLLEYYAKLEYNKSIELSTDYIYGNRTNTNHKGQGMYIREALAAARKFGDAYYTDFPYNTEVPKVIEKFEARNTDIDTGAATFNIDVYFQIKGNKNIKENIYNNGPCICSVPWRKYKIKDGILEFDMNEKSNSSHAMVIYGWNEKGWLIQNSWGRFWGTKGTIILPYNTDFNSVWGVYDEIKNPDIKIKKPNTFIKKWYKLLNMFMQFIQEIKKLTRK